ncbi:PREDICTED: UBX domain-containing protein 4 [Dufourea novaeangliae]|uniref:UBX domain-containing protein 4 n=1 Tax=Dufourea novaeangliae TaxID=178035 RepID=A0A154P5G0_DUFNO|nr:PREDICTED: UBX domain-containing protein 4 [Dufourea novaeangliae]KZC07166.1 UBX domain-containing protein 4 [Dufourea novaeangliae]
MKWFEGSITEAVATSKSRKAIFVVFVEGKDDTSAQVAESINTTEVSCRLEQDDVVAIRLESGSENYRFFAQIYQLVPVPSIFFISTNGTPLEIIAGTTTAADLITKIELVLSKARKNENSSMNLIDAEKKATASSGTINSNTNAGSSVDLKNDNKTKSNTDVPLSQTTLKNENSIVTTEDVKVEPCTALKTTEASVSNSETQDASTKELSPEEKVERAKQLIELQRVQHVEEEKQKEKEREIERRKIGRDVQKMRQKQQDLEIKQAHDERLREKAADAAAREKVRQQIAQDKLERKQRESAIQQQMQKQQGQEPPKLYAPIASDASVTRIQFKLPSGSPHMGQFEPTNTLRDLRNYVVQNIDLPFRQFAMSISFPRRDLTAEEDNKTLLQLELVPTAVILILPLKNPNVTAIESSTPDVGFLSRFMWSFVAPVMYVYNYMIGYFSGGTRQNTQRPQNSSPENVDAEENSSDGIIPNLRNVPTSGLVRRYLGSQGGTTIKTEGHIHRLHSGGEDNDENNTWNGNSTQQM